MTRGDYRPRRWGKNLVLHFHIFWQIMKQCVKLELGANVFSLSKNCSSLLFFSTRRRWRVQTDFWHWAQTSEEWKFFFRTYDLNRHFSSNILMDNFYGMTDNLTFPGFTQLKIRKSGSFLCLRWHNRCLKSWRVNYHFLAPKNHWPEGQFLWRAHP